MSKALKNKIDFMVIFEVTNGNPNGDPDMDNAPRTDIETGHGLVTDVCLKRKIRDYVAKRKAREAGYGIYITAGIPTNRPEAAAIEATSEEAKEKQPYEAGEIVKKYLCDNFFDIRTFGAVLTSPN